MSTTPRVSVVIPSYNRQDHVVEAIESVLSQTFTDFEIIVVDDGSTDGTNTRIQPYLDRLTYTKQENRGVAVARNAGIRLAKGEFICFLDSDDLWEPVKLQRQISFADAHPEYGLLATELQGFDTSGKPVGQKKSAMYDIRNGLVVEQLLRGNWIQTSTVMVRRECLDEAGWFDEDIGQFGEDWLMWMRAAARFPIYFMPESLVSYRYHPGRLTLYQREEQFLSLMRCLKKIEGFPQFQRKPELIREAEYRICVGRGKYDLANGDHERAIAKLNRARNLRKKSLIPLYFLLCATVGKIFRGGGLSDSVTGRTS
ncbi:MAG: glycosyltransferase [Acidobacteriaceae bacterium]